MLKWNAEKVKNLTASEIWFFLVARVLIGFGVGVLSAHYFPGIAGPLGISTLIVGLVLFVLAAKGLRRTRAN
jgi:F0F1-type ATP synthase assembly protein I